MSVKQRAVLVAVVTFVLGWGLSVGIGYPVSGDPAWLYMWPVTWAGFAVLLGLVFLVGEWIYAPEDRNENNPTP